MLFRYHLFTPLLLICIQTFTSFGQGTRKDSVAHYYHYKNKAELAIIDSNYRTAEQLYHTAFTYKKPNARELYNVMIVSYLLRDTQNFEKYYDANVLKGFTRKSLEMFTYHEGIGDDPFYQYCSRHYDSLHAIAESSNMPTLAIQLDTMHIRDRRARSNNSNELLTADSANRRTMANFIDAYGFPGFELIGYYDPVIRGQPRNNTLFWFMLWHARYMHVDLDSYALKAVREGDFPPEDYALLMDVKDTTDKRMYYEILSSKRVSDTANTELLLPANIEDINRLRAEIFLDNLSDYRRKLIFMQEKGRGRKFQFLPIWAISLSYTSYAMGS